MEQPRRLTFPGFPEHCRLGHLWKPDTVVIDWRPCDCRHPQEALDTACTIHLAGLGHEPAP